MIDKRFLFKVALFMLPKPRLKKSCGPFDDDRAETLDDLPLVKVGCMLNAVE